MRYILFNLLGISILFGTTIHIPADYSTIQGGINAANEGDTIVVDHGEYYENLVINKEIVLASHAIYSDLESNWFETDDHILNTTIYGYNPSIDVGASCIAISHDNIQPTVIGFTFRDGRGTTVSEASCGPDVKSTGGAIFIYKAYPIINYNRFINNGSSSNDDNVVYEGGAIVHYDDDDIEFDEDRDSQAGSHNHRTIPNVIDFRYNYFSGNNSSAGLDVFSDFEETIDLSFSIFDNINCETNEVNGYTLGSKRKITTYNQANIEGYCSSYDTVYVSIEGDDEASGEDGDPFKTITNALRYVKDINTTVIKVAPGEYSPFTNGETFPLVIKNNTHLIGDSKYTTVLNAGANISKPRRVLEIFDGSQDVGNGWIADNIFVSGFTITGGYHIDDL